VRERLAAFRGVFANRDLRRVQLAWAGSMIGSWAYSIAIAIYAYHAGGARAVGIVGFARWTAAALASPFAAAVSDRVSRKLFMVTTSLGRAAVLAGGAIAIYTGAPALVVYLVAGVAQVLATAFRPAQAALVPALARTPDELTAANVVSSTIESVGIFGGPALGGVLLTFTSTGTVFLVTAGALVAAAALLARVQVPAQEPVEHPSIVAATIVGFGTIAREPRLRLLVGLFSAQTFVQGVLNVLIVVTALQLLDIGNSGVGWLNAAFGVGGVLGGFLTAALIGRRRLAGDFGVGILLWSLPIALIGAWPSTAPTVVLLALVGVGNTLVDVSGFTLLQRAVPERVLARVFGILESLILATLALGALVAPALVAWLGVRGALVAAGAVLPALVLLAWRPLAKIDAAARAPEPELRLLHAVPFLAALPAPTLERLAASLEQVRFPAGAEIFSGGDPGDRFYVIEEGTAVVSGGPSLGAGGFFGEIALLRDVPRTATVRAETDVTLYALERADFITAVTGHRPSLEAANAVIDTRLGLARA